MGRTLPTIDGLDEHTHTESSDSGSNDYITRGDDAQDINQGIPEDYYSHPQTTPDPESVLDYASPVVTSPTHSITSPTSHASQDVLRRRRSDSGGCSITDGSTGASNGHELNIDNETPQMTTASIAEEDSDGAEDIRLEAIEFARIIKSKGKARPLFEQEFSDLPMFQNRRPQPKIPPPSTNASSPPAISSKPQRIRQESGLACLCSKKCDGRCGCRKDSRPCGANCHSGKLRASISEHGDTVCCGNIQLTLDGRELWPPGWTMTETFVGTEQIEEEELDVGRLWDMYVLDQRPVISLIEEAGGIDAFLVQEGYGREFGLLKRGMAGTPQAQQSCNGEERETRRQRRRIT